LLASSFALPRGVLLGVARRVSPRHAAGGIVPRPGEEGSFPLLCARGPQGWKAVAPVNSCENISPEQGDFFMFHPASQHPQTGSGETN